MVTSGTSMAVPHVVGTASLLWQKDTSKSKEFIRDLLEESARPLGDKETYGKGIIDYEYAEKVYPTAEEQYQKGDDIQVKENTKSVKKYDNTADEAKVEGTWSGTNHQKYLTDKGVNLTAMKAGAVYPDSGVPRMSVYPDFHGYYHRKISENPDKYERVNYLASYRFLIKIGNAYGRGESYTAVKKSDIPGLTQKSYDAIRNAFKSKIHAKAKGYSSNSNRKAFVFGVAMHSATDAFAHSTYKYEFKEKGKWGRIDHPKADDTSYQKRRFTMAYRIERNNLYRFQGKRKEVAVCHDFHASGDKDGTYYVADSSKKYYRITYISKNATEVHITDSNVIKHYGMINLN